VGVRDRLASVTARIKDNAISGLGDALRHGHIVRLPGNLGQQVIRGRSEAGQVRIVSFRDDEHVNRSLRIDVTKSKRALSFKKPGSRDLPGHDFAE
jgi:hypothetical protein